MKFRNFLYICVFLFLLTGCGTATTIDSSSPVKLNALHVVRPATLNNIPMFERAIKDVTAVQNLFKAANALPDAPRAS